MKNQILDFVLLKLMIFLLLVSCGGAPKPPETPPPSEGVKAPSVTESGSANESISTPTQQAPGKDALDALNAAMTRAENARKAVVDVQGQVYFPEDWKAAESKHEAGKNVNKDTADGVNEAIALYTAAAEAYEAIAEKSGVRLAQEQEDALAALQAAMARAEQSQKQAQDVKGPTYFPKDWQTAETNHQNGKDAKKDTADEIKAATALYTAAADRYDDITRKSRPLVAKEKDDALKALNAAMARAENSRKQAMDVEGQTYFPNDWKSAESKNQAGKNAKKESTDEIKAAAALYISAAEGYDDITRKSRPLFAKDKDDAQKALDAAMARAEQSRKEAQGVEGETYFPKEWQTAESKHQNGKAAKKTTTAEIKAATVLYNGAADGYDDIVRKNNTRLTKEEEDARKALNAAIARMENSRKQALDNQGPAYFPKDWQNAESQNQAGQNAKKDTTEEIKAAVALYVAAADSYDDIAGKSRPLFAKDRDDAQKALNAAMARAEQSRKETLNVEGQNHFPKDWQTAESQNKAGKDAKKTTIDEIKSAAALYTSAADTYDAITNKTRIQLAKEKDDAQKALNAAMARAEQSRKNAIDVNGQTYFPNDWQTAESQHQTGQDAKKDTTEEIRAAAALYTQAADTYDDITGKTRPLFAKDKDDAQKALNAAMARAEQSRKNAMDVNGQTYFPNDWQTAESQNKAGKDAKKTTIDEIKSATTLYTSAADTYDDITGKSRPLLAKDRDDAQKALNAAMARAEQSRKNAMDVNGQTYFPNDWKNAESKNQAGQNAKKNTADEIKAAAALYTQAADSYDDIAGKSRPLFAKDKDDAQKALNAAMARAEQSRKQAQDAQAPAYFPKDWQTAESKHQDGKTAKKTTTEEIKAATTVYIQAADAYDDVAGRSRTMLAQEQGDALKALQDAMARAEQSRKQAQDAQAPAYFPKDWQNAESKNQAGQNAKKTTADEMKAAAALYIQAADAYDDVAGRSRTMLAQEQGDALKALQDAMARAEQSRKQALGFQGPEYFPKDWQTAETQRQSGNEVKGNTPEDIKAAAAFYTAAADMYDDITRKSRPQYIQAWEDALRRERTIAVDAGIGAIAPDHLGSADRLAAETRRNLGSDAYIPEEQALSLPLDMYRSLKPRAEGYKVRQEIIERGFSTADPETFAAGDKNTLTAIQDYESGNPKTARNKADEALEQYHEVLMNGWLSFAQAKRLEASKERQAAVDVKAHIAVRDDFNHADRIYQQALTDFDAKAYEAAADLYSQSSVRFIAAAQSAEEKRRQAEETIAAAKQKTAESTARATNLGLMMEGEDESR
ncbi:MAG: hypothetical protein LBD29_08805 [Treponema sp.]|jgi:hypothetical protein|nr:hypothetical protein [Treponema sp.]